MERTFIQGVLPLEELMSAHSVDCGAPEIPSVNAVDTPTSPVITTPVQPVEATSLPGCVAGVTSPRLPLLVGDLRTGDNVLIPQMGHGVIHWISSEAFGPTQGVHLRLRSTGRLHWVTFRTHKDTKWTLCPRLKTTLETTEDTNDDTPQ